MSRGDYLSTTGGTFTSGGQGGNRNVSVYEKPDSSLSGGPTGQGGTGGDPNWQPSGVGAVGQDGSIYSPTVTEVYGDLGSPFDDDFGSPIDDSNLFNLPTFSEVGQNISEYVQDTVFWSIGNSIVSGDLISDTGEWLGDLADSPWNPMNWESGEPPEWTVYMGDPRGEYTTLASGSLEATGQLSNVEFDDEGRAINVDTGAGGTTNITRETLTPDDEGYIDYLNDFENPESLELEDGFMYDYSIGEIVDLRGDPYAYRRIDYSNAWKEAGINDLLISDEEWNSLTEEEKQANFAARQAIAEADPYNFGGEAQSASPFSNMPEAWESENSESELERLKEMYLSGEITSTQLLRYQDDILRSQGLSSEQDKVVTQGTDFLRQAGYTEEEIAEYEEQFRSGSFDTDGVRTNEGFFDVFEKNINSLREIDPNAKMTAYDMYDTKREEDYNNAFNYLDSLRGTDEFSEAYSGIDVNKRNAYLTYMYNEEQLTPAEYQLAVAQNLANEGEYVFQLEDGRYAVGTVDGIYGEHSIIGYPEQQKYEEGRYYEYEKDKTWGQLTSLEGADDEFNERRARVAAFDNAGGVSFDHRTAQSRPEPSRWKQFTGAVTNLTLNALTGGLYSAIPAGLNILKGEGNSEDWLAFTPVALEAAGFITAPLSDEEATAIGSAKTDAALARGMSPSDAAAAGAKARDAALAGTGIELANGFTLSYDQTLAAVEAATTGDFKGFAVKELITPYVSQQLRDALPQGTTPQAVKEWQDTWDNMPDDVKAGLDKTMQKLLDGKDFDEAATRGVLKYIEESPFGGLIEDKLKSAASSFDDNVLQPLKDFGGSVVNVDAAKAFLSNFDDEALQPFKDKVQEVTEPVTNKVVEVVDKVIETGQELTEPVVEKVVEVADKIVETGEELTEPVVEKIIEVVETGQEITEEVIDKIIETSEPVVEKVEEVVEEVIETGKEVTEPIVDVIEEIIDAVEFPDIGLNDREASATRTTDSLFSEMFKFKTQVGISPEEELLTYNDLQGNNPFGRTI